MCESEPCGSIALFPGTREGGEGPGFTAAHVLNHGGISQALWTLDLGLYTRDINKKKRHSTLRGQYSVYMYHIACIMRNFSNAFQRLGTPELSHT